MGGVMACEAARIGNPPDCVKGGFSGPKPGKTSFFSDSQGRSQPPKTPIRPADRRAS
jgi:hypothetical protein